MASQTGAVSAFVNEEPSGKYANAIEYDVSSTRPIVTLPGSLYQSKKVEELKGVAINAAFIGGCMGGRIEDVRIAADILKGKRIKLGVRLMVGFASNAVYLQAAEEGLIDIFMDSGAQVTNPGCGSCQTTSIGVVGDGEVLITTGSHNHPGCAGTEDSSVYIASAATVATAALNGYIRSGEE
jgi:3-isopropylmalate/(R)-2-methylmalate dehydratase large subunit